MRPIHRPFVRTVLMIAAVAASPIAAAQGIIAEMGKNRPSTINEEGVYSGAKARLVMEGFARCVVSRHRPAVLRAVALPPMSAAESKALAKLVDDDCLRNGTMNFSAFHFRGGLYTALYRERSRAGMGALNAAPVDFSGGMTLPLEAPTASAVATRQFVDCAVRRRPEAAHQVIVAKAGSTEENAGFSALLADLRACVAKDAQIRFTRTELEGLIAEVMYLDTAAPAQREAGK